MREKLKRIVEKLLCNHPKVFVQKAESADPQQAVDGCIIENGILISYEVQSECCIIPEGVTELKDFAIKFNRDRIKEVVLPSTIRYIRKHNFSSCKNLARINFPEGLLEIGEQAFDYCDALKEIKPKTTAFMPVRAWKRFVLVTGCRKLEKGPFNFAVH